MMPSNQVKKKKKIKSSKRMINSLTLIKSQVQANLNPKKRKKKPPIYGKPGFMAPALPMFNLLLINSPLYMALSLPRFTVQLTYWHLTYTCLSLSCFLSFSWHLTWEVFWVFVFCGTWSNVFHTHWRERAGGGGGWRKTLRQGLCHALSRAIICQSANNSVRPDQSKKKKKGNHNDIQN